MNHYGISLEKRLAFIFMLACILTANCMAQETNAQTAATPDLRVERNITYLANSQKPAADLYFPASQSGEGKFPAVILIHGGGWQGGRRDDKREISISSTLARNGYFVMSIDYLLANKKQAVWPTNLWDCKTAVRWLRKNADRLGVDPERIGVMGGSAGGQLAAMVALTTPADGLDPAAPLGDVSCRVKCCVDFYGIADIGAWHDVAMLGKTFAEAPELYRAASPLAYVRSNSPPVLIVHGTADKTVDVSQSKLLDEALSRVQVKHELVIVPGAVHSFDLQPKQLDLRPLVLKFLNENLPQVKHDN